MAENRTITAEWAECKSIVAELIDTVHEQAKQLERLAVYLPHDPQMADMPKSLAVITARLSALHYRIGRLELATEPVEAGAASAEDWQDRQGM